MLEEFITNPEICRYMKTNVKALIVEDDHVCRTILSLLLMNMGVKFDVVVDGKEALACMLTGKYDIIYMDHDIPELSGAEATKRFKEQTLKLTETLIVFVSGNTSEESIRKFTDAGMDFFIPKPITHKSLADSIKKFLNLKFGMFD